MERGTDDGRAAQHRDALLEAARLLSRGARHAGSDPADFAAVLLRAWQEVDGPPTAFDPGFHADPGTGVEALAFVVDPGAEAGLVLRLAGEHPDSFERIDLPSESAATPEAARRTFFGGDG
jgi:hypothetical protein